MSAQLPMSRSATAERELEVAMAAAGFLQLTKCILLIQRRVHNETLRRFRLGVREIWILLAARCDKAPTQKQIAKALALNENALVLLLDRLERGGYALRMRNPENRREQFVRLTPKGENLVRRILAERAKVYRNIFFPLEDVQIQALINSAKAILTAPAVKRSRRA